MGHPKWLCAMFLGDRHKECDKCVSSEINFPGEPCNTCCSEKGKCQFKRRKKCAPNVTI